MSGQTVLSDIFERSLSLDNKKNSTDRAMSLWEDMACSLDEIAANTKPGLARKSAAAHTGWDSKQDGRKSSRKPAPQPHEMAFPGKRERATSAHGILASPKNDGGQTEQRKVTASPLQPQAQAVPGKKLNAPEPSPSVRVSEQKPATGHSPSVVQAVDSPASIMGGGLLAGKHATADDR